MTRTVTEYTTKYPESIKVSGIRPTTKKKAGRTAVRTHTNFVHGWSPAETASEFSVAKMVTRRAR